MPKKKFKIRWADLLMMLATSLLVAWGVWTMMDYAAEKALPPCLTEDSDNCYWDAKTMGNGQGRSFTVEDGVVTYK